MDEATTPEKTSAVAKESSPAAAALPGRILREARERQGMSVADVAKYTHLASRQIEALETDDYEHLPELPFVRGFIRSYARLLQIAPEPLLAGLPHDDHSSMPRMPPSVEAPFPSPFMVQRRNLMLLGTALLLVVAGFMAWNFMSLAPVPEKENAASLIQRTLPELVQNQSDVAISGIAPPVAPNASVLSTAVAGKLHLRMSEKTWVEIHDRDGNLLLSQNNPAGSDLQIEGQTPLSLVLGQTRGVQLIFNGRAVVLPPAVDPKSGVVRLTLE